MATPAAPRSIGPQANSRVVQDLVVSACGLVTSLLTAFVLAYIEARWGVSLYSWSLWFVIPIGAGIAGFGGATGYYFGAKLFGHRPTGLLLVNILLASIATYFFIHYMEYSWLAIDGVRISERVPFFQYLDIVIRSASMEFRLRGAMLGSTGVLGAFGYVVAFLQVLGFAVGGVIVDGWLRSQPYCDECSRYLVGRARQSRGTADTDALLAMVRQFAADVDSGEVQRAITDHHAFGEQEVKTAHHLKSVVDIRHCRTCSLHWFKFSVHKRSGNDWKQVNDLTFQKYCATPLRVTA